MKKQTSYNIYKISILVIIYLLFLFVNLPFLKNKPDFLINFFRLFLISFIILGGYFFKIKGAIIVSTAYIISNQFFILVLHSRPMFNNIYLQITSYSFIIITALSIGNNTRLTSKLKAEIKNRKTLEGLLPICFLCKKIRNDEGYWESVEKYIESKSDASFTHGICEECYDKYQKKIEKKKYPKKYNNIQLM